MKRVIITAGILLLILAIFPLQGFAGKLKTNQSASYKLKTSAQQTAFATLPSPNLLGYWTFDGHDMPNGLVKDISGNNNNGNTVNMATSSQYVPGKIGQGLNFVSGTNSYVNIGNVSSLSFERTDPFSISLWFKQSGANVNKVLFGKLLAGGNFTGYEVNLNSNLNFVRVEIISNNGTGNKIDIRTPATIQQNVLYHFVVTYDGSSSTNGMALYLDGVKQTPTVIANALTASIVSTASVNVGSRNNNAGTYNFNGMIDDVRVYNRVLTNEEIKSLYNYKKLITDHRQ